VHDSYRTSVVEAGGEFWCHRIKRKKIPRINALNVERRWLNGSVPSASTHRRLLTRAEEKLKNSLTQLTRVSSCRMSVEDSHLLSELFENLSLL
jgi:hypothetical protein